MADSGQPLGSVAAGGHRGVAVGGSVIGSAINTGDYYQIFIGDYERLQDFYLPPWETFDQHDPARFVGRQWLADQVDEFLDRERCGYFVLEADAGVGKSAFLAELVRTRGYLHHFVRPGTASHADPALKSLAAQLVRVTGSDPYLPAGLDASALFGKALGEAARRLRPGEQLVLVIDGLDEADTPSGCNPLGLPSVLPPGVYCVVSHRPGVLWAEVKVCRQLCQLRAEDGRNLADMHEFLRRAAVQPGVAEALAAGGYSSNRFVATLADKCRGVWIYLRYVVDEIERGDRSPLDLDNLPYGVWQYYAQFWNRWQDQHPDAWDAEHLPLLATLGAAQEPATLRLLCALAEIAPPSRLRRVLEEWWRPFLAVTDNEDNRYSVYHASLREFLAGQLAAAEREQLTDTERRRLRELADATRQAHGRIANRYLSAWGELATDLSGLHARAAGELDDGYGLRHLTAHLSAAGRLDDLRRLLTCQWTQRTPGTDSAPCYVNTWFTVWDRVGDVAGYLRDVDASRAAAGSLPDLVAAELLVRASLAESSVVSRAGQIPPPLLARLVADGEWALDQAAAYARSMRHPGLRSEALALLAARATDRRHRGLMEEALQAVEAIESRFDWYEALLPRIAEVLPEEVVRLVLRCPAEGPRFAALRAVAPMLPLTVVRWALDAAMPRRGQAYQPVYVRRVLLPGGSEKALCEALISLIIRLPPAERLSVARQVEEAMTDVKGRALAAVAGACSSSEGRAEPLARAIEMARSSAGHAPAACCLTLARAAPFVPSAARTEHVLDVIRRMESLSDDSEYSLGEIIAALAAADPDAAARQLTRLTGSALVDTSAKILRFLSPSAARELAASIDPAELMLNADLVEAVVSRLDTPDVRRQVRLAKDKNEDQSSLLLKVLVRHLPDDEALDAARALRGASARARVLASLVGRIDSRTLLQATAAISDFPALVTTLASIAASCPATADDIVRLVLDDVIRREALATDGVAALRGLSPVMSEQAASAWLDLAAGIAASSGDRHTYGLVAARLSPPEARRRIEAMSDPSEQDAVRNVLAVRLGGEEGLDLLSACRPDARGPGLADLIVRHRHRGVTARFVHRVRDLAATVEDAWQRTLICALLLPITDPPGQPAAALACVRHAAQGLADDLQRLAIVALVQPWLCADEAHQAVLELLGRLGLNEHGRSVAWTILSDTITPGPLRTAIRASATEPLYGWRDTLDPAPAGPQPTLSEIQEWTSLALDRLVSRQLTGYDPDAEAMVAHYLKPAGSRDVSLQDAYDAAWKIGSDHLRARALAMVLPYVVPHQQVEIGKQALEQALRLPFVDLPIAPYDLPHPLRFWSLGLQDFTERNRGQLFQEMLRRLGRRPRSDLLRAFSECAVVLAGSVPPDLPAQLASWVVDAGCWWP